jgi:lipopolysaccharide transport system ATP-binding protein
MSDIAIKVENLSKLYHIGAKQSGSFREIVAHGFNKLIGKKDDVDKAEEFWALKDVSFEIKKGEAVGIIGRNGAGKSTLLKILSRITEPTSGRVTINGRVASLLEVGTGFHPELTGRENIFMNGAILGMKQVEIKRKFDEIVDFSGIEKFIDTPVKHYSSGMYVRLAFAVAAHLEPEILIVDEVLAVGDAEFQKKCLGKMNDVSQKEGRTVLFVSHNLTAVKSLCTRGVLLKEGLIQLDSNVRDVMTRYLMANENRFIKIWSSDEAPHNSEMRLISIQITDLNGGSLNSIDTDTPFGIEIAYQILKPLTKVGFTLIIKDVDDNYVLCSINNHEQNYYGKDMPKGDYKSVCTFPENYFNNGKFNIDLNIFKINFTEVVSIDKALQIEIYDGTTVRGDYHGGFAGVVRPKLEWKTKILN